MVRRRWFLRENIQRRAGNCSRLDRVVQRTLINKPAACAVDNSYALLHARKSVATNDASRFRSQRCMDGNKIRTCEKIVKRRQLDVQITRLLGCNEGIEGNNLHTKRARP